MQIALSKAKARLTALVRQAESGEDIVLTRNGKPVARIVRELSWADKTPAQRRASLEALVASFPARTGDTRSTWEICEELDNDIWESHGLLRFVSRDGNRVEGADGAALPEDTG